MKTIHFIWTFILIILSSCNKYLPHTSKTVSLSSIPTIPFRGKDTTAFYGGLGYSEILISANDYEPSRPFAEYENLNYFQEMHTAYGEFGWIKNHESFNAGASIIGYCGNYIYGQDNATQLNQSYCGVNLKGKIGYSINWRVMSWHPINFQYSGAYDFGEYPKYRESQLFRNIQNEDNTVVPQNAWSNVYSFYSQADFLTHKKVGFSILGGVYFEDYFNKDGFNPYDSGLRAEVALRLNRFNIRLSSYASTTSSGYFLSGVYIF